MKAITWLIGGLMLGLIGSAAWAATVYYTGWEVGAIAWAVGLLAGLGVRISAKDNTGPAPAMIAFICAIVAVGAGKAGTIGLYYYGDGGPSEEDAIVAIADTIVRDWEREGRPMNWPGNWSVQTAHTQAHYPPNVWSEAAGRWFEIPYTNQQKYLRSYGHLALLDGELKVTYLADQIVEEKLMRGEVVGVTRGGSSAADYAPQVWNEAVARWSAMDEQQRRAHERFVLSDMGVTDAGDMSAELFLSAMLATLGLYDILWLGLAAASAWRIGYGYDSPVVSVQQHAQQGRSVAPPAIAPAPSLSNTAASSPAPMRDLSDTSRGSLSRPMGGGAAATSSSMSMSNATSPDRKPMAHEIASPREMDETTPIFDGDEKKGGGAFFGKRHAG